MAVELVEVPGGKILEIRVTGKLTKEDYEHFEMDHPIPGRYLQILPFNNSRKLIHFIDSVSYN